MSPLKRTSQGKCHLLDTIGITYSTFFLHTTQSASEKSDLLHAATGVPLGFVDLNLWSGGIHWDIFDASHGRLRGTVTSTPKKCHYSNAMEILRLPGKVTVFATQKMDFLAPIWLSH